MSRRAAADFASWADAELAGSGWSAATVREAAHRGRDDLATAALADGFAAAALGVATAGDCAAGAA